MLEVSFELLAPTRDQQRLEKYLISSDSWTTPALSERANLKEFALKILTNGVAAVAVSGDGNDVGVVAFYCNDPGGRAFLTHLAVNPEYRRSGLGKKLTEFAKNYSRERGMTSMALEVYQLNENAKR